MPEEPPAQKKTVDRVMHEFKHVEPSTAHSGGMSG